MVRRPYVKTGDTSILPNSKMRIDLVSRVPQVEVGVQNSANVLFGILKVLNFSVQFPDFSPGHHSRLDAAGIAGRDIAYRTVADCIRQYGYPRIMTDPHDILPGILNRDDDFRQCCFDPVSPHDQHRDSQAPIMRSIWG